MLARWLVGELGSGSIADYYDLPERYLWAKIAVAAGAPRSEADYISLPKQHVWKAIYDVVSGSSLGTIDWSEKQALGHIAAAYRGDTGDAGALATYIDWPWRYQVASIIGGAGTPVVPFAPTDIPNIRVWFDANENVKSFAGNNFTDEIASFAITGSIYSEDNGTYNVDYTEGLINGRNRYRYNNGGGEAGSNYGLVYWNGTQWVYELWEVPSDGDPGVVRTNYGTGNTTYPWNATWSMGTFTRTPTTVDISATNNQSVVKWYNRVVAGGPVIQNTLAAQPIYETNVYGKKVLSFNADSISGNGAASANWGSEYSVYCVATNLGGSTSFNGAFATSHSTITSQRRGALGGSTTGGVLAFTNGTQRNSTLSVSTATFAVWSYRFTTSGGSVALGKNKTFESLAGAGSSPSPFTNFMIGTAGGSNSSITKIGEIIGYSGNHNEATANQIIDYLAAKWGIAL